MIMNAYRSRRITAARRWLRCTHHVALTIEKNHPACIESRPFSNWILTQELFHRELPVQDTIQNEQMARPSQQSHDQIANFVLAPPLFIPQIPGNTEPPRWTAVAVKPNNHALLLTVLETARRLGDHQTMESCLLELINRADSPLGLFNQLEMLKEHTQGDLNTARLMRLYRYQLCTDDSARQELYDQIKGPEYRPDPYKEEYRLYLSSLSLEKVMK
ncbi:hypothetical protein ASPZODRAFT_20669 [Penicilliopsis zonata CBS 506.65]|uniref:Uncharacterized protein n=1 Tax=Penicilliopsis zonata CBS 506.65 TaxID=1073090 RepID=A0A1L9S4Y4_9EURO|nr:hypothetical protein ASPZODRAFT_20669 [Penicilliopsis zonata CBS 506.65]OJJ42215.1 hypothetical protein ASPZODRAFT_20669 [Penicilliopsis zonata CBS 506.65]